MLSMFTRELYILNFVNSRSEINHGIQLDVRICTWSNYAINHIPDYPV